MFGQTQKPMNFDLEQSIKLLQRTPQTYKALFYNLGADWATINEGPNTWCAIDIVGHLIHGENTDWIPRAKIILDDQIENKTFEPYDRFAQENLYQGRTIESLLDEFEQLRMKNIEALKSWNLDETQLIKTGIHPDLGEVTLKQLIATWTIHDMSHLNQLSRVMVKHYKEDVGPWLAYSRIMQEG